MRLRPLPRSARTSFLAFALLLAAGTLVLAYAGYQEFPPAQQQPPPRGENALALPQFSAEELLIEFQAVVVRLPLAAALGTALALRPRRRGTPIRQPAVVQTQIILAIVGALIMLVVGASIARAFGIVGAANLIRYRSKIDDPKDAVVMLSALAVGLAAGVGLFILALFSTMFLVIALWVIEGFEPQTRVFELTVKLGDQTAELKPKVEAVLRRFKAEYELRQSAEDEVCYQVTAPLEMKCSAGNGARAGKLRKSLFGAGRAECSRPAGSLNRPEGSRHRLRAVQGSGAEAQA